MIYSVENTFDVLDEFLPMTKKAWDEVDQLKGVMEYDPNLEAYRQLNDAGQLRLYTIREEDTKRMVGYALYLVQPVLHCKGQFTAISDVMYIEPEYRKLGTTLLTLVQEDLKLEGVKWFTFTVKDWLDNGKLAERLGCKLFERVYQKEL
jgi:hypothetical protein